MRIILILLFCVCCSASLDIKENHRSFSCTGRHAGYYADIESGCQLYHLCDNEGRRFTHTCPNATLFQQRMMVCDHWYMVDCSKALDDYKANLRLGERSKPFLSSDEQIHRHPVKELIGALPHLNVSSRRARNRVNMKHSTSGILPEKYKNNIFLKRLFATVTPRNKDEINQNVLELHLVDPRHMFYIPEDSAASSDNNTVLFISLPSTSSLQLMSAGVMKFHKEQQTSELQNPSCPKCHPAYLLPGKCEPCVIIR